MRVPRRFRGVAALLAVIVISLLGRAAAAPENPAFVRNDEPAEPLVPSRIPVRRNDVYDLKVRLAELGFYSGPIDDVYDETAVSAVKAFQKSYWLTPDGVVEKTTWRALGHGVTRPFTEAVGEPPEGRIEISERVIDSRRRRRIRDIGGTAGKRPLGGKETDYPATLEHRRAAHAFGYPPRADEDDILPVFPHRPTGNLHIKRLRVGRQALSGFTYSDFVGISKRHLFTVNRGIERTNRESPRVVLNHVDPTLDMNVIEKGVVIQDSRGQFAGVGGNYCDTVLIEAYGRLHTTFRCDSCMKEIATRDNRNGYHRYGDFGSLSGLTE